MLRIWKSDLVQAGDGYADYCLRRHARHDITVTLCDETGHISALLRISRGDNSEFLSDKYLPESMAKKLWSIAKKEVTA